MFQKPHLTRSRTPTDALTHKTSTPPSLVPFPLLTLTDSPPDPPPTPQPFFCGTICVVTMSQRYDDEDDDGMDDSDRGSDSDEDTGARARKVLSECSKLSTRLAEAISKWTGDEGEERGNGGGTGGAAAARGALEISSLKGGGKTVTTNEEIQEACPGLKLNP